MRALVISFLCMAVIISGWGIFVNYADKNIHELTDMIEKDIMKSVNSEDWEAARTQFADFSEKWHKQKKTYTYFYHAEEIMDTDYAIARAKSYIEANDTSMAVGELNSIKEQLGFLHLNELITLDNIF